MYSIRALPGFLRQHFHFPSSQPFYFRTIEKINSLHYSVLLTWTASFPNAPNCILSTKQMRSASSFLRRIIEVLLSLLRLFLDTDFFHITIFCLILNYPKRIIVWLDNFIQFILYKITCREDTFYFGAFKFDFLRNLRIIRTRSIDDESNPLHNVWKWRTKSAGSETL